MDWIGWLQVYKLATLTASSTIATVGVATAPFSVQITSAAGVTGALPLTYSLDAGDGAGPRACTTLGTTASNLLAATTLTASVTHTSTGVKTVVVRVYNNATCAVGATPAASATIVAVGTVDITVSWFPHVARTYLPVQPVYIEKRPVQ